MRCPIFASGLTPWLAALAGLAFVCQWNAWPVPADGGSTSPGVKSPAEEDPEVAAYFRRKGWRLYRDVLRSDGKQRTFLSPEDRNAPLKKVILTDDDYRMIAKSRAVQVLNLSRVECSDAGLKVVAANTGLEAMFVGGEGVTDAGIKALAGCKTLAGVALFGTRKVTDAGLKELAALPNLRWLHLDSVALDGSCFEPFARSRTLRSVTLNFVDGFTDAGARHLAALPNLEDLKIHVGTGGLKLTAAGLRAMVDARLPAAFELDPELIDDALFQSLVAKGWLYGPTPRGAPETKPASAADVRTLALGGSRVTDKGIAAALHCTNITFLDLARTGITDATLEKLSGFKRLESLHLGKTRVTAAGLNAVAGLPIKNLSMQGSELTEDMFKAISRMTTLEALLLPEAKMKADWLKHISGRPKLSDLVLTGADFDDAAVKHVVMLKDLQHLSVNQTNLGDAGFRELVKLPRLALLEVAGTKVTEEAYLKARKENPNKSIYFTRSRR